MNRSSVLFLAAMAAVSGDLLAQFPNDECTGAIAISQGVSGPFTNVGATTSVQPWTCGLGNTGPNYDLWYSYTAPAAGPLTVDMCNGTTFDSVLEVYSGTCGSLVSVACNDDACSGGGPSQVSLTVTSGTTYYVRVGGWGNAAYTTGTFFLDVNGPVAPNSATNTALGLGCIRSYNSFYQRFVDSAAAATALSGNTLFLVPTATGYQGSWLPGTAAAFFVPPVAGTPLATADDGVVTYPIASGSFPTAQGPQTSLLVSGNGIIAWGGAAIDYPGTQSYVPTANGFLNSTLGGIYAWHDYNVAESGSGQILAEEVAGVLYITFNGVESYASPETVNPSTLQFQLDLASGLVKMVFVSIDGNATSTYGSSHVIGVTAPGASLDPISVNLASALPGELLTTNPETVPLSLTASSRPITGTNWNLTTNNIPATGLLGVDVFGLSDPGINDLFFLGAPGCGLRASLDVTSAWFVSGTTHAYSLPIPANPALINVNVYTTSSVFQVPAVNALGAITANGMQGKIGNI